MSYSPIEHAESLRIGTVDFVSPNEIKASLDIEAPEAVSLNAGGPRPFPRINNYVLIPVDEGFLVGQIEWLTVEKSPFPKRRGMQDFGLVDLPFPLRKMSLNPLGTLQKKSGRSEEYSFKRGAESFPSVGTSVFIPTIKQLRSIVESGERRRVKIGTSPLASNAEVSIDPDRLFGRHLAVLGNTGSGKSCSVAGLIRWSLEAAKAVSNKMPNARFIVLDPNGEYARAFGNDSSGFNARVYQVKSESQEGRLKIPLWFWNSAEWSSFTQATARTQRPLLKRALREVRAGKTKASDSSAEEKKLQLRRHLSSHLISIQRDVHSTAITSDPTKFGYKLKAIKEGLEPKQSVFPDYKIQEIVTAITGAIAPNFKSFTPKGSTEAVEYYSAFSDTQIKPIEESLTASLQMLGGIIYQDGPDEDAPLPFDGADLADHLQTIAEQENATQFLDFFISRIRTFLSDRRIRSVVGDKGKVALHDWLHDYIGSENAENGPVTILDLSLVPTEIVHVVTSVIARQIFEALQRYRKLNQVALPTVLVMEEAHTFIKRYKDDSENHEASTVCCQVFERISREGRKFGLGLVLSSQRPSELSPTVLSQCNTFLLHRISNDRDQELVNKLVPDNLRGLLRELPSLPSQNAILLGWASELPILVRMNDLAKEHQPQSEDPDYWNVWSGKDERGKSVDRKIDWKVLADDWQGISTDASETE